MPEHFTQWAWASWASGSQPAETAAAMRAHLDAGCPDCTREQAFWTLLATTMRQEREPMPRQWPEWTARALAMPQRAAGRLGRRAGVLGVRLTFDNLVCAAPPVRGVRPHRRHCVYDLDLEPENPAGARRESSGTLEVMSEPAGRHRGWNLLGQVLNASREAWRDCLLELSTGNPAAPLSARTNAFGEFSFAEVGQGPWQLELQAGQRRWGITPLLLS